MNVIAKMHVRSIEDYGTSRRINFQCVYDNTINTGDNAENVSFTKATPSGEAWMTVDNQAVWPCFRLQGGLGADYRPSSQHYVVFVDAEKYNLEDVRRALTALEGAD